MPTAISCIILISNYNSDNINLSLNRLQLQLKFHRLMIMLCTFDTIYVLLNILLFALPKMWTTYEETGVHYYVLPKAIPFGMDQNVTASPNFNRLTDDRLALLKLEILRMNSMCSTSFGWA